MTKVIIMGSGAAPGVPAIAGGWGDCNPENPKNKRRRTGVYLEFDHARILIDTSPDLRSQLLDHQIRELDAVLYTHSHADHLNGIDDLREINRVMQRSLDIYGSQETLDTLKQRFGYLLTDQNHPRDPHFQASLIAHTADMGKSFYVKDVKITPIVLNGHGVASNGYIFNDGEIVYIADCYEIPKQSLAAIKQKPKLLIIPLTILVNEYPTCYHMGLDKVLEYVNIIGSDKTIINHMAIECDYDHVNNLTPDNVFPAYDNMITEI